VLTLNHQNT
jgi:hypothetical protein